MPDAVLIAVAKAITTELASADFGPAFTPVRNYGSDDLLLDELNELRVDVVPVGMTHQLLTRGSWEYVCQVDVGVRKRFDGRERDYGQGEIPIAEIDSLVELLQRIGEYFAPETPSQTGRRLTSLPEAVWSPTGESDNSGIEFRAACVREHLRENGQYTGIVRLTYRVPRSVGE